MPFAFERNYHVGEIFNVVPLHLEFKSRDRCNLVFHVTDISKIIIIDMFWEHTQFYDLGLMCVDDFFSFILSQCYKFESIPRDDPTGFD